MSLCHLFSAIRVSKRLYEVRVLQYHIRLVNLDIFNFCFFSPSAFMALRFPAADSRYPTDSVSALVLSYIYMSYARTYASLNISMYCTISAVNRDEFFLQDKIRSTFFGYKRASSLFGHSYRIHTDPISPTTSCNLKG